MAGSKDGKHREREHHYRCAAVMHPLRQTILCLTSGGGELSLAELASHLDEPRGRVAYHLEILVRRGALKVVPRRPPAPPLYTWSSDAEWARKMLDEIDARAAEDE